MSDDPDDPTHPDDQEAILDERREARAALPAIYIDTWSTLIWKGHMRITVGEYLSGEPRYRASYLMELDDAKRFAEHILRRVERQHQRDAKSVKKIIDQEGGN